MKNWVIVRKPRSLKRRKPSEDTIKRINDTEKEELDELDNLQREARQRAYHRVQA